MSRPLGVSEVEESGHPLEPGDAKASLRWIIFHMIEETARRNGHADFLREAIDDVTANKLRDAGVILQATICRLKFLCGLRRFNL